MNAAKQSEPSEIELLLPWYAAGTLDARKSQQVEAALANDPELAARYEWVRAELEQETHVSEAAGEPSGRDVKALFAKIDALPAQKSRASIDLGARIAEFLAALSPRTLAWSAMAAALAIVLQAGFLAGIMLKERSAGGYETASAPANVSGEGSYVLLALPAAGHRGRRRQLSGNQQTDRCWRAVGGRTISGAGRANQTCQGGPDAHRQYAAG